MKSAKFLLVVCGVLIPALFPPALLHAQDSDGDGMPDSYENSYGCLMPSTVDARH